jgi:hypothetical protein
MFLSLFIGLLQLLHVLPRLSLLAWISQKKGWMKGCEKGDVFVSEEAAPKLRDGLIGFEKRVSSKGSYSAYQARRYRPNLAPEKREASSNLIGLWVAILWRTALDDVAYIDFFPSQVDGLEHLRQELSRLAHKRKALYILFIARPFTHENQLGFWIPGSKNDMLSPLPKFAPATVTKILSDRLQGLHAGIFTQFFQCFESLFRQVHTSTAKPLHVLEITSKIIIDLSQDSAGTVV